MENTKAKEVKQSVVTDFVNARFITVGGDRVANIIDAATPKNIRFENQGYIISVSLGYIKGTKNSDVLQYRLEAATLTGNQASHLNALVNKKLRKVERNS